MLKWLLIILMLVLSSSVRAVSPIEELQQQIDELARAREQSVAATKPLETELSRLKTKLDSIEAGLEQAKQNLRSLELSIAQRQEEFGQHYILLAERALSFYKASRAPSSFFVFFASGPSTNLMRDLFYRQVVTDRDKDTIGQISADLLQLEADKKKVEADRVSLADLQAKVDKEAKFFEGEISGAKAYQAKLSQQIAVLTARQQQIIGQRQAALGLPTSLGAGPLYCTDDRKLDPGFSPGFAFYTYGIPHRVGMNQYGAYGRSKAGQGHEEILRAYFANFSFENRPNIEIEVQGYGRMPLETYLLGIYEMPESWPLEALKAQAIAARSYALAYTNNGAGSICTSQACQVYKQPAKGGAWKEAVEQTAGKAMISSGEVVKAWYSSTDGGYTFSSGDVWGTDKPWTKRLRDTSGDVGSFGELNDRAYDRESPCFYAAQGWRSEYAKSAWLKSGEVADIVNVLMLAKADGGTAEHLYQTDKPHPFGGENWSEERVKSELRSRGITPYNSVSSVSVGADFGSGQTNSISVSGDGGSQSFSGSEFKNYFNLRAPANIQIVGPLYNVERR